MRRVGLGGTIAEQTCEVHTATPNYTVDISFPIDYPEQQAVVDDLERQLDSFIDWVVQRPERDMSYALDITGRSYRSGTPASGTRSLVLSAITDDAVIFFIGQGMWVYEAAGPQAVSVPRTELASVLA